MREMLIHRPLVLLAIGLILGILALTNLVAVLVVLGLLLLLRGARATCIVAVGFLAGALLTPEKPVVLSDQIWVDAPARVTSVPRLYRDQTVAQISMGHAKLSMALPKGQNVYLRDRIHIRGVAKPLSEGSDRLLNEGVVGRLRPVSCEIIATGPAFYRLGQSWRDSFTSFCERFLPEDLAAAVEAVCFNVDSSLDETTKASLANSGTIHIVSASGFHVGILSVAFLWLLSRLPIPRHFQLAGLFCILALYCIASGLHPPVIRASLMALVLSSAYLIRREPDLLSALALAAIAQLLWQPLVLFDVGFQLSFAIVAMFGLFKSFNKPRDKSAAARFEGEFLHGLRQTALATVASTPLVAYCFGTLSITSIVANMLLAAALPVMVVAAMLAHAISYLVPIGAAWLMGGVVKPLTGWLFFVTDSLGGNWAAISVPAFSGYWVLLAYALMLCTWNARLRPA